MRSAQWCPLDTPDEDNVDHHHSIEDDGDHHHNVEDDGDHHHSIEDDHHDQLDKG